jgi:hypothetical protein
MLESITRGTRGPKPQDWTGRTFGHWRVLGLEGRTNRGVKLWRCKCVCGTEKSVAATSLPNGASISCGCVRDALTAIRSTKHGNAKRTGRSAEYRAWQEMMKRCFCTTNSNYADYGARGITVCERWQTAANFIQDMPVKPAGKFSLGRINNDGNYELGNVEWQTDRQQSRNTRRTRMITFNGETMCLKDMASKFGFEEHIIRNRLNRGWSAEKALTTPKICAY